MLLSVALVVAPRDETAELARHLVEEGLVARADLLPARDAEGEAATLLLTYATVLTESVVLDRCARMLRAKHPVALLVRIDEAEPRFHGWVEEQADYDAPLVTD